MEQESLFQEMEETALYGRVECMLFVAGDPVPLAEIARVLDCPRQRAAELLTRMEAAYRAAGRGVLPVVTEETAQLVSSEAYFADVEALLRPEEKRSVSQSLLETLAVIAYRQPATRADVENVRGVRCDYAVTQLAKMGLIAEVGRRDTVGRPAMFGTTDKFLRQFGIHSVAEMPDFARYSEAVAAEPEADGE